MFPVRPSTSLLPESSIETSKTLVPVEGRPVGEITDESYARVVGPSMNLAMTARDLISLRVRT